MSKGILKKIIYINIMIIMVILSYKVYLFYHEADFQENNYQNMKRIESNYESDTYSFAVFGSARNSIDVFQNKIINDINASDDIIFAVSVGDAVADGAEDKYRILSNSLKQLKVPNLVGVGNLEVSDGGDIKFYKHFGPYYFSFAYGESYFIFIDTTGMTSINMQKDWVSEELAKADNYDNKFVFMNDSPVKSSENNLIFSNYDVKDEGFKKFLRDEFSAHKVNGVFTNGTSTYKEETSKGVTYYSSGGAGGLPLEDSSDSVYHYLKVSVYGNGLTVQAVEEPLISNHFIIQKIENLWFRIHSIFYINFLNYLLAALLLLLMFLVLHKKASDDVDYYRDFNSTGKNIDINDKLNVAMFTNNYLPFLGGVPISINRLASALRKRGNKIVIFAPKYPSPQQNEQDVYRCKLISYRRTSKFDFAVTNIYSSDIEKEFNKGRFDIVHVHHPFWMGKKGMNLAKKYNVPVILTYHTRLELYFDNVPIFKLVYKNILSHKIIKRFAQKCDAIIAPTASAKVYLENVGVSRQKLVLPTGVEFEKYQAVNEKSVKRVKDTYVPMGEMLLCSVSRLSMEKNIGFLIKGLKFVKENTAAKFKCIIIGIGPERENIQNLIDESSLHNEVILIGCVDPAEMPQYYLASDLFVFSSQSETQGMAILEAMAGKCPVVCIKSSGIDDVVRDGCNGYKTSDKVEEWAEKVILLLENKDILEAMSSNAFIFSQNFSVEKMAERVELFYKKTIAAKIKNPKENL